MSEQLETPNVSQGEPGFSRHTPGQSGVALRFPPQSKTLTRGAGRTTFFNGRPSRNASQRTEHQPAGDG
jgi:hypothetical protein